MPAPKSTPPPSIAAGNRRPSGVPPPPLAPLEPAYYSEPGQYPMGRAPGGGPQIEILAAPARQRSRRGVLQAIAGVMLVGAGGTAWWLLRPDGAVDWSQKVTDFRYGKQLSLTGSIFVPTAAATTACPLLVLVDPTKHGHRICAAFASQCEKYGVVCVASDVFGGTVAPDDPTSAADVIAYARANANVDSGRVVVLGSGVAAEVALRLAMLGPEVYAGAILEFVGLSSWRDVNALARNDVAYFLFTRTNDSGRDAIVTLKDEMQRKGLAVTLDELPGGHKDMEDDELDAAFAWMASLNRQ